MKYEVYVTLIFDDVVLYVSVLGMNSIEGSHRINISCTQSLKSTLPSRSQYLGHWAVAKFMFSNNVCIQNKIKILQVGFSGIFETIHCYIDDWYSVVERYQNILPTEKNRRETAFVIGSGKVSLYRIGVFPVRCDVIPLGVHNPLQSYFHTTADCRCAEGHLL